MSKYLVAILISLIGLLIILVPTFLLPVCSPIEVINGDMHNHTSYKFMKCHWTSQAEIGIGSVILVIGIFMLLMKSHLVRLGMSLSLIVIALLVAAIPTVLIGVCPGETMACHIGTLPGLLLLSMTLLIICSINAFYLKRHN
ncbi:DUF4418 family protein [Frischella perrara]|uniref:DUF4418 family protein n=1 Tax=Frischella perrara TaxID=1267021 RepID=UPI0023F37C83|nr:DUF4418 family protein [Frischella perrara]